MSFSVDIEIILKEYCESSTKKSLSSVIQRYLTKQLIHPNSFITTFGNSENSVLFSNEIRAIIVGDIPEYNKPYVDFNSVEINWFIYNLEEYGPMIQREDCGDGDDEVIVSTQLALPSSHLVNLWENLYYETDIKQNLLKYAQTMMEFSDKGVESNIITCNRIILLHGPPGTGKTSLCKALAQKVTIRMNQRFTSGLLIEVNSHSLLSKWYSESGKLVSKMFSKIREIVENRNILVCLLIDEVESLTHARDQCVSGTEPSDSIRVVNALLTQIDQMRSYPNILILATSNMTDTIDLAFVDRADIKQFLGLPSVPAIYKIYFSCITELMRAQIVKKHNLEPIETALTSEKADQIFDETKFLLTLCEKSLGLSGRSLRKIPFIARALFLDKSVTTLTEFLSAMEKAINREHSERQYFKNVGGQQPMKNGI